MIDIIEMIGIVDNDRDHTDDREDRSVVEIIDMIGMIENDWDDRA